MTSVDHVISTTFDEAECEEKCKAAAGALRSLYAAGQWDPAEIMKAIAAVRTSDEAN